MSLPPLAQALTDYDELGRKRFHVPAHAGRGDTLSGAIHIGDPYRYDLTELDGLDVLSDPEGCLKEAQARIAELFGTAYSFFLVNGATVGLLAAMLTCVKPGEPVLLARNVHRSVLSGLVLCGGVPVWILPERLPEWGLWGGISADDVANAFKQNPAIRTLVITSPTYEGIGSDIAAISPLCKANNVTLIVDEAHGSLWPFCESLPKSAIELGADLVVHSIHKSGGCLTQGALAHIPEGSRISPAAYQQALNLVQTTSPSYLLMASLESACHFLASQAGQARINTWYENVITLRKRLRNDCTALRLYEADDKRRAFHDPAKLYLTHATRQGDDWGATVEEDFQLSYESASPYGTLYLANIGLEMADFEDFVTTLVKSERYLTEQADSNSAETPEAQTIQEHLEAKNPAILIPEMLLNPRDAYFSGSETVLPYQATGRVCQEVIVRCPPGIPVLIPGERILTLHVPFLPEGGVKVVAQN